jgi:alanine dehydrogenase
MIFCVPKETLRHEHRVGLTPFGVSRLVNYGHEVFVEHDAGRDSHFADQDFATAGASIVYSREEAFGRADVICRVGQMTAEEIEHVKPGATVMGFLHLAVTPRDAIQKAMDRGLTMVGYEVIEDAEANHPVLRPMSEIAGHMVVHIAAHLLEYESGGRGLILGNIPAIPPATVVVIGAGTVGWTAARIALANGAHVIVLDQRVHRLRRALTHGCEQAVTALATPRNIARFTAIADVVIGAVLVPGGRAPYLVTEDVVKRMKPGAVVIDLSIDQGGCVETSRPTTPDRPTFKVHGVTHYCVPNMTANAPRTASRAMVIAALPYLELLASEGTDGALRADPGFARGAYLYQGTLVHEIAGQALGLPTRSLSELLG